MLKHRGITFLTWCVLALSTAPAVFGQDLVTIRGKITDSADGSPLANVEVSLSGESIVINTDPQGFFEVSLKKAFPFTINYSLRGYEPHSTRLTKASKDAIAVKLNRIIEQESDQLIVRVFGRVQDANNGKPLKSTNILVKDHLVDGREIGTVTDSDGKFILFIGKEPPFDLTFSHVGYQFHEVTVNKLNADNLVVNMLKRSLALKEVTITGQKVEQKVLKADATVEKLDIRQIQRVPSFDFYDALANMKDVEIATQSMQFKSVNSRGFNATGNVRFVQMVDGMDNQAPGFNFPIGNFGGVSELDLENIELYPGPSSAKYGPNAFNGILFMQSKDPFIFQGVSAQLKLAANRFPEGGGGSDFLDFGGEGVYDFAIRYAKAWNDKIAFKTTFSIIKAKDWAANDVNNIGEGERFETHAESPGYDGVNIYGDEIQANLPIGPLGTNVLVTRTGYAEENLMDYNFTNYKINSALHYKINDKITAILQNNFGTGTTFYTGDNRVFLGDFQLLQTKLELNSERFMVRTYTTQQRSGNSYDSRFLALQLMRTARSDEEWFRIYELAFRGLLRSRGVAGGDHEVARQTADSDFGLESPGTARFEPSSDAFNAQKERIINTQGFDTGAGFTDNSALYHVEGRYSFLDQIGFANVDIGGNYRLYDPESEGIVYPDSAGNDITMFEYGGFIEATKEVMPERLKIVASLRFDKNENFQGRFTPRLSSVYTVNEIHNFRASFQTGFRNPTLREQFIFQSLGSGRAVGGLGEMIAPLDLAGNAFFTQTVDAFNEAVDRDINPEGDDQIPLNQEQAELRNLNILQDNIIQATDIREIRPEQVSTFELGYKSLLADGKLVLDVNYYHNTYQNFIGIVRVIKPKTSPQTDAFLAARQVNNSVERDVFFINSNASESVISQGISFNVDYTSRGRFVLGVNGAWANLTSESDDPIVPGFNTPSFKANYTIGHNRVAENVGFKFILRTRRAFQWESNFGDGEVPEYFNLDTQVSIKLPKMHSLLKIGFSNIGNEYYADTFGGPRIGAVPYIQITYDPTFY
ncbi:MAG: TonB-dependent receptor [Bacteroidota bacterium]